MKTIFNTYIKVENQVQADRLRQICVDNGLLKEVLSSDFNYFAVWRYFIFDDVKSFFISCDNKDKTEVTESEWLELLKQHQCTK